MSSLTLIIRDALLPPLSQWNTDQDLQVEKKWTENGIENN